MKSAILDGPRAPDLESARGQGPYLLLTEADHPGLSGTVFE
jgi:hypothetical protein